MPKISKGKQAKLLPNRVALADLQKRSTIVDYAKSTPLALASPTPAAVQNLRMK